MRHLAQVINHFAHAIWLCINMFSSSEHKKIRRSFVSDGVAFMLCINTSKTGVSTEQLLSNNNSTTRHPKLRLLIFKRNAILLLSYLYICNI